jgi:uncharacterized protein YacL
MSTYDTQASGVSITGLLLIIGICYHLTGTFLYTLLSNSDSWKLKAHFFSAAGILANIICLIIDTVGLDYALTNPSSLDDWYSQISIWRIVFNAVAQCCSFFVMMVKMEEQYEV